MHNGRFIFSELISHLPHKEFQKCVARYDDDSQSRAFSHWDQYLTMAFAQLTYRESLRDIEACLDRKSTRLNSSHLVISYAVFCLKKKKHKRSYHKMELAIMCWTLRRAGGGRG